MPRVRQTGTQPVSAESPWGDAVITLSFEQRSWGPTVQQQVAEGMLSQRAEPFSEANGSASARCMTHARMHGANAARHECIAPRR